MLDDSILYTGASSASFNKAEKEADRIKREEKAIKRAVLVADDAGEILLAELQKEIDKLKLHDFSTVKELLSTGIPNALEIDMLSKAQAHDILQSVKIRVKNIMRNNKNVKS